MRGAESGAGMEATVEELADGVLVDLVPSGSMPVPARVVRAVGERVTVRLLRPPRGLTPTAELRWESGPALRSVQVEIDDRTGSDLSLRFVSEVDDVHRRAGRRAPLHVDVTLMGAPGIIRGRSVDVSQGGSLVSVPKAPTAEQLRVRLALAEGDVIVAARVVRVIDRGEGVHVALQFVDPPPAAASRLAAACRRAAV